MSVSFGLELTFEPPGVSLSDQQKNVFAFEMMWCRSLRTTENQNDVYRFGVLESKSRCMSFSNRSSR